MKKYLIFLILAIIVFTNNINAEKNYYEILEIERTATLQQIREAYKELAKKWHPDKNLENKEEAEEKFKEIKNAYDILSDPITKANYDKTLPQSPLYGARHNIPQKEALKAAKGMNSREPNVRREALGLFKSLFEKGQGFKEAIKAAAKGMMSSQFLGVRREALGLFKNLFEKDQGFDEAIKAAAEGIKSDDSGVCRSGLDLFKALFEKDQGFDEAIKAAAEGIKSDDSGVCRSGLNLFKALVKKNQGFDEAINAAVEGMKSSNPNVRSSASQLKELLKEKRKIVQAKPSGLFARLFNNIFRRQA